MKSLLKYMALALVAGLLLYGVDALAANTTNDLFGTSYTVMGKLFKNVRTMVYVLGAFALVGVAVAAVFGKLPIKWLAYVAVGLGIIAVADLVIQYALNARSNANQVATVAATDFQ